MKNELIQSNQFTTNDLIEISKRVSASGLLGKYNENQIFTLMMLAYKDGTNPVQASMDYHIIQNKPALSSQATLSRFQKSGGRIKYIKRTDTECVIEFTHGQAGTLTVEWNMNRARQAGLDLNKENWKKYPRQMLAARCLAEGVRALYPACLDGLYLVEEVQDFDNEKKIKNNVVDTEANTIDNTKYDIETNSFIDDFEKVPRGRNKGKFWKDCDIGVLSNALDYYQNKDYSENYIKVIEPILNEKLSVCEEKKHKGQKWADMETELLEDYYNKYTSGKLIGWAKETSAYIKQILDERKIKAESEKNKIPIVEVAEDENPFDVEPDPNWDGSIGENNEEGFFNDN